MELKIRKTRSGTYYIPSIPIRELRKMMAPRPHPRRWSLSKDETRLILE